MMGMGTLINTVAIVIGGILGMLVAVPITATIYRLVREEVTVKENIVTDRTTETAQESE